jgi:hypothetical protein
LVSNLEDKVNCISILNDPCADIWLILKS